MPDKKKPGDLLAEQAADLAKTVAPAAGPAGVAVAGVIGAAQAIEASAPQGSMAQYLIASGGSGGGDKALGNAILGAMNKMASLKSRM